MAATRVRFHYGDGRVVTQTLRAFATANGTGTVTAAKQLLAQWETEGKVARRADGGYDVREVVRPKLASSIRGGLGSLLTGGTGSLLSGE